MNRPASWKWWITGLLLLATTINYMDRVTLANASVRVTQEFGLSDEQYGHLELVFGWAFAAGSLVFGFLADRFRIYWLYPCVLAGWSLMGMISGWTRTYEELLVCRMLLGFFEAGHWPCALKTTFALLSEKDRTMGNSVLQSGASIGAIITPQIMALLMTQEDLGSWRSAFIVVGAAGLLWVAVWFILLRPAELEVPPATQANPPTQPLCGILLSRNFWALALLITGTQTVWHIYRVWLMKFLQTGRGYSEAEALNFTSLYYISTDVGCVLAGVASLWLVRRFGLSPHHSRRRVYAVACGFTSLSLLLPWLGQGWVLLGVLLLIGAGALALFPCYYSFVQELSVHHVGRLTGLLSLWVWAVTSPLHRVFGNLADRSGSYDTGLVIAGLAPWIGVAAMALLWQRNKVLSAAQ
ncbi:Sugar phosphate permease [Prosthecobacter debontii]|uniref:Sugar phosphate permease n=1 Tax=Prosthecobacter debontii TaxID=48467 RepID=A0A1T4WH29_9BACT|nr:MFS transporter [Prosthecobacter debontii]SKA76646.1 Sugar phosphate permease [Prosthecobacter debontii]